MVSVIPAIGLAVSHDGTVMKYLTASLDALTRYSKCAGEKGPPWGPLDAIDDQCGL